MSSGRAKTVQPLGLAATLACLAIATVRGGNPVAMKIVLRSLSPMQGAFARTAVGALSVGLLTPALSGTLQPRRDELGPLALLSLLYGLQIAANQTGADYTSPVLVAILFSTYPIFANLLFSLVVPEDRLNLRRLLGLGLAFSGVTWVILARMDSALAPNPMLGNALVLLAAVLLSVRLVYVREVVLRVGYAKAVFWPLVGSLPVFLLGGATLPEDSHRLEPDWTIWAAILFQGAVVGGAGQLAWVFLIRRHPPGRVVAFSFLTPVSGVGLSALYFAEPVPANLLTGFAAVLAGIALPDLGCRWPHSAGIGREKLGLREELGADPHRSRVDGLTAFWS